MESTDCPHCKKHSAFQVAHREQGRHPEGEIYGVSASMGAIRCQNSECGSVFGALIGTYDGTTILDWWPRHADGKDFPDVPEQIGSTADEAHGCMSIGAYRGAVALARAVVEATAKHHEIESGNLQKKIEQLAELGIISSSMKDAANEIRFAGNEVAHADLVEEPIQQEDAADVLGLMDAILTRVYQEPKQVERVRTRRKARETTEAES